MLLMEPWLSNIEPENFRKPWVRWAYQPVRPQDVPATFIRAYAAAVQPAASSVFLSLPLDDWEAPALGPAEVRTVATRIAPDPSRLAAHAKAIDASTHPALVFGAAVAHGSGWAQAVALAEQLGTPVCGRSGVRASPVPRNAFAVLRWIAVRQGPLAERLAGHGLVVVGAPVFRYYPFIDGSYLPDGAKLWHVTDDRGEAARAPVGDSVPADAVLAIGELTKLLAQRQRKRPLAAAPEHRMAPHPPSDRPVGETLSTRAIFDKPAATGRVGDLRPTYRICTPPGLLSTRTASTPSLVGG